MEGVIPWHMQSSIPEGITVTGDNIGASIGVYKVRKIYDGWVWRGAEKEPCKIREHATRGTVWRLMENDVKGAAVSGERGRRSRSDEHTHG
jgi:hypothetical protein